MPKTDDANTTDEDYEFVTLAEIRFGVSAAELREAATRTRAMPDDLSNTTTTEDQRRRREWRMYPAITGDRELDIASLMRSVGFTREEAARVVDRVYRDDANA